MRLTVRLRWEIQNIRHWERATAGALEDRQRIMVVAQWCFYDTYRQGGFRGDEGEIERIRVNPQ